MKSPLSSIPTSIRILGVLLLPALLVPAFPEIAYPVFIMKVLCYALFALAFNLLIGFTGLVSFGHAAFFGWAGYTTYIYENPANGYCLGSLGPGTNGILESACHDGLDQQFFMNPDGFWQNAGASAGTGKAYIADADYADNFAEITAQTGSSPNSHEQWIR